MQTKKYLVASDIHGSLIALQKTLDIAKEQNVDKIILLGDIFGANATEMVNLLNDFAQKLDIVKGNNDWYFEPENAKFQIYDKLYENINGRLAYLSHGHRLNDMDLAGYGAKIIMIGHVHRPILQVEQGIIFMCPGSIAVPRGGSDKTYAIIDGEYIRIYNLDGEIIDELKYWFCF